MKCLKNAFSTNKFISEWLRIPKFKKINKKLKMIKPSFGKSVLRIRAQRKVMRYREGWIVWEGTRGWLNLFERVKELEENDPRGRGIACNFFFKQITFSVHF